MAAKWRRCWKRWRATDLEDQDSGTPMAVLPTNATQFALVFNQMPRHRPLRYVRKCDKPEHCNGRTEQHAASSFCGRAGGRRYTPVLRRTLSQRDPRLAMGCQSSEVRDIILRSDGVLDRLCLFTTLARE
jgi:hypothetical protein